MENKIIEKYIKFAFNNGYAKIVNGTLIKFDRFELYETGKVFLYKGNLCLEIELTALITSKEFIEAIANGGPFDTCKLEDLVGREEDGVDLKSPFEKTIDRITFFQSIAIRDGKLQEFITNLITNL